MISISDESDAGVNARIPRSAQSGQIVPPFQTRKGSSLIQTLVVAKLRLPTKSLVDMMAAKLKSERKREAADQKQVRNKLTHRAATISRGLISGKAAGVKFRLLPLADEWLDLRRQQVPGRHKTASSHAEHWFSRLRRDVDDAVVPLQLAHQAGRRAP